MAMELFSSSGVKSWLERRIEFMTSGKLATSIGTNPLPDPFFPCPLLLFFAFASELINNKGWKLHDVGV